jgi:hypothetical protein
VSGPEPSPQAASPGAGAGRNRLAVLLAVAGSTLFALAVLDWTLHFTVILLHAVER